MKPTSPTPWRAVRAGQGWLLRAADGTWVANFHGREDAVCAAAAVNATRWSRAPGPEVVEILLAYRDQEDRERQKCLEVTRRRSCGDCAIRPCSTVARIAAIEAALGRMERRDGVNA